MDIPVTFEFEGKQYAGHFSEVNGMGSGMWHLMADRYYWGRLRRVGDQWYFDENKPRVGHLVDYFAAVVIAWYE